MKRTIEKLSQQRKEREEEFENKLQDLRESLKATSLEETPGRLLNLFSHLKETLKLEAKKSSFPLSWKKSASPETQALQIAEVLAEFSRVWDRRLNQVKSLISSLADGLQSASSLMDARDREWDALGSNHVGMIFKSLEWRVDKLAASYEDASLLIKRFIQVEEKLTRLLLILEEKKIPSRPLVEGILKPLEEWRYTGFENRFRGPEEEVKKQQEAYLPYFQKGAKVLDLGCGRGEFIQLLHDQGIDAEGVDINGQMVEICLEKGLKCQKADLLERLAEFKDGALGGIFSSQVIEHLEPVYLKRMIELAYAKLSPSSYLVVETINPASVFSLVQVYFLDLSHRQPIHSQTLRFLLESAGFEEVEIKYSAPLESEKLEVLPPGGDTAEILNRNLDKLNELLYAPANYAAIGLKKS